EHDPCKQPRRLSPHTNKRILRVLAHPRHLLAMPFVELRLRLGAVAGIGLTAAAAIGSIEAQDAAPISLLQPFSDLEILRPSLAMRLAVDCGELAERFREGNQRKPIEKAVIGGAFTEYLSRFLRLDRAIDREVDIIYALRSAVDPIGGIRATGV